MKIHTLAWIAWLTAGLVVISATRNPLYLLLLVLVLMVIQTRLRPANAGFSFSMMRFFATILLFSTGFNALISRFGETVLFTIPETIPLLGGPITLEALLYGATNGLVLNGMFTLFMIINSVVPVQNLVRLIPQAFNPLAVVTTIALTFIPATQQHFHAIRDAQAMRGQRLNKLRDWLPLFIPLLIGGLERSMQIAEAMTARGYALQPAAQVSHRRFPWSKLVLPFSLICIIAGWLLLLITDAPLAAWILIALGTGALLALFYSSGRRFPKTRLREQAWNMGSIILLIASMAVLTLLLIPNPGRSTLIYDPYPLVTLPALAPLPLAAILMLLAPILLNPQGGYDPD